jgi:tetratricopeptide (TPR) repeat protein
MASFNAGQYADAVRALSDWLRDFPLDRRREEALFRIAESYRNLGRTDDALAAYAYELKAYPDGPFHLTAAGRRGASCCAANRAAAAAAPLRDVAQNGQGELRDAASYLLGEVLLATNREAEGRAALQALVSAQPPGRLAGSAAQALAELDDSENRAPEALALWQQALAATSDAATQAIEAARGGWSALAANQPDTAEKLFQQSRQLAATGEARQVANTGLLRVLFDRQRYSEWVAVYDAEQNAVLASARAEILDDLGHAQFALKHWSAAATAFDQYLREFPAAADAAGAAYARFLAISQLNPAKTIPEAEAFLKAWPQSPDRAQVRLLEAQEYMREKNYAAAAPLWEELAQTPAKGDWPHLHILLERARAYDELSDWPKAATSYRAFLDEAAADPKGAAAKRRIEATGRLAVALQNSDQLLAATDAWKELLALAPAGAPERQMALESLGLIYSRGGPAQQTDAVATFRALLDQFPASKLRALAAFTVGDSLFQNRDYAGAEPLLMNARTWDPAAWMQPATQRLALAAYGRKDAAKTAAYVKDYDALPPPSDPQAAIAARLPAALFYWLATETKDDPATSAAWYQRVIAHPDPGELLAPAWWALGLEQMALKQFPQAVGSFEQYRALKPEAKDASSVLLQLGQAQLGAKNFDAARALANQVLLQEPEGRNSALARLLLGDTSFDSGAYAEAAKMYASVAILFSDPELTPRAMAHAAESFTRAGDAKSAADWRARLAAAYPGYK